MKITRLFVIFLLCFVQPAFATDVTSPQSSTFTFGTNGETLNVTGSGSINTTSTNAVNGNSKTNLSILVDTTSSSDGIISGTGRGINLQGSTLNSLQINKGTVSSGSSFAVLIDGFTTTSTISVGQASDGTATLSNSANNGYALYAFAPSADLTLNLLLKPMLQIQV